MHVCVTGVAIIVSSVPGF